MVTLAERWGGAGFTADGFDAMVDDVAARLASFESIHCIGREIRDGGVTLLGTSGTVTTLAGIALALPRYRRPLVDGVVLSAEDAGAALATPAGDGSRGPVAAPLRRPGPRRFRVARLRSVRRDHPAVARAAGDRGRPRPARGHAAAHDARRAGAGRGCAGPHDHGEPQGSGGAAWRRAGGLAVAVRSKSSRSAASQRWLARQLNDPYVAAAKAQGWRSRAAFKLIELDERFGLLRPGARVVDLGAAPGGWTQVAVQRGAATVVALDLLPIDKLPGAVLLQGDFLDPDVPAQVVEALGGKADLVLSDMAPNTTGHAATDHLRIMALAEAALEFAVEVLAEGGTFVAKVFQGGSEREMLARLKQSFASVRHAKPPASRKESSELYVVAQGFRRT